jgi:hypothetical protein
MISEFSVTSLIDKQIIVYLFFFLVCKWEVESILGPLGTAAITGLLYLSRVIVRMKLVEWVVLAGETEVLEENLPRRHFVHKSRAAGQRLTTLATARPH